MNPTHPSCSCGGSTSHACDCCTGPHIATPQPIFNPPGLSAIGRRAGTWGSFRRTMQARLSSQRDFPALQQLTTREPDDPSIAFLDAAASVCDVLTFYSERLANEGYLRTATQRRSLTELGNLVGYRPRPGVAASAWLAFTLDTGYNITIPAGTRVQSVPSSTAEKAQTFETSAALSARAELNHIKPRLSVPQEISPANVLSIETVWLKGTGLSLKPGDMLLFAFPGDEAASTPRKIHTVTEDAAAQRTTVKLEVEKLSAAYHVPVLRKAAQALRLSIPDAWLTDAKTWAKGAAGALDVVIPKLGADTSLLKLEELFLPSPGQTEGLDDHLQAASDAGDTALSFRDGLALRAAWESEFTENVEAVLEQATAQEKLLGEVFTQLELIDAHPTAAEVEIRKTAARELVKSLAEGTDTAPGEIRKCFPSVKALLTALRRLAANASDAANHTVWNSIGLGPANPVPARTNADGLGLRDPEETERTAGMAALDSAKDELTAGKPDGAAKLLLDDGDDSLQKRIDAAAAHAAVKSLLQEIKDALDEEWTNLQTPMYQKLDAGAVEDELLQSLATKHAGHVDALPIAVTATHESRAVAFVELAGKSLELLEGDGAQNPESKTELEDIATTGLLSKALTEHRKRLRAESLVGFRHAIQQLTSRYKAAVAAHPTVGPALALLQTEAATFPPNGTLAELHEKLTTALNVVRDVLKKETNTVINQLRAEMEILDGQVSFSPSGAGTAGGISSPASGAALGKIVGGTTLNQPDAPGDPLAISRSLGAFVSSAGGTGGVASDAVSRLAGRLAGSTDDELFAAWRLLNTGTPPVEIYIMRVVTTVFGSGAPMRFGGNADKSFDARFDLPAGAGDWTVDDGDLGSIIRLEGEQNKVVRDSYIVIERPRMIELTGTGGGAKEALAVKAMFGGGIAGHAFAEFDVLGQVEVFGTPGAAIRVVRNRNYQEGIETRVRRVQDVLAAPHSAYSLSGKATTVTLLQDAEWGKDDVLQFEIIRRTRVHAASELLTLAGMPVERVVGREGSVDKEGKITRSSENPFAETTTVLMLGNLYQGLEAGHRILLAGQRADDISARPVREYALVSKVEHSLIPALSKPEAALPGDTPHTRITLSKPLQYYYLRDTVTIYGNVAEATHGETKREVLGSGNARAASQEFLLRSVPVTHVAAATASGAASTVQLRVDRVLWDGADQFTDAGPADHVYVLKIADDGATSVVFGDGKQCARLPTGVETVTTVYRSGIGQSGNVGEESLTTLLDRPLGLKEVRNPLAASGGADRDSAEDIRRNAPLPLLALDRLVSVSDYGAFSRAFAGIGKAEAALIGGAGGSFVHVTIAGQNDAPIGETSSLMASLTRALVTLGDPLLPVRVQSRELLVLMLSASVRIAPELEWATVEPALRAALLAAFGFDRRQLGQNVFLSDAVSVMQRVPGVDFVDVDAFGGIPQMRTKADKRTPLAPEELEEAVNALLEGKAVDWVQWDAKAGADVRRAALATDAGGNVLNPPPRIPVELAGYYGLGSLRPAQLALFLPDMPETLILNQLTP